MTFLLPVMLLLLFPCAAACLLFRLQGRLTLAVRVAVYVLVVRGRPRPPRRCASPCAAARSSWSPIAARRFP